MTFFKNYGSKDPQGMLFRHMTKQVWDLPKIVMFVIRLAVKLEHLTEFCFVFIFRAHLLCHKINQRKWISLCKQCLGW